MGTAGTLWNVSGISILQKTGIMKCMFLDAWSEGELVRLNLILNGRDVPLPLRPCLVLNRQKKEVGRRKTRVRARNKGLVSSWVRRNRRRNRELLETEQDTRNREGESQEELRIRINVMTWWTSWEHYDVPLTENDSSALKRYQVLCTFVLPAVLMFCPMDWKTYFKGGIL